jgi:hypothetical protein
MAFSSSTREMDGWGRHFSPNQLDALFLPTNAYTRGATGPGIWLITLPTHHPLYLDVNLTSLTLISPAAPVSEYIYSADPQQCPERRTPSFPSNLFEKSATRNTHAKQGGNIIFRLLGYIYSIPKAYDLSFDRSWATVMIKKILFLTPIFHILALGGGFLESCTNLVIPEGTSLLHAKCNDSQKIKIDTVVNLYDCVPCLPRREGPRQPCPWGACVFLVPADETQEKRLRCHSDDVHTWDYGFRDLGEFLLLKNCVQIAHIV